jgi:hypothetical protein
MIIIILIIICFALLYAFFNNCNKKNFQEYFQEHFQENFEDFYNIKFLDKKELMDILLEDKDNYYKTFSKTDLIVRKVNTIDEYKEKIKNSCLDISESNKTKLSKYINKANEKLRTFKITGFDGNKCADIPWIIGLTNNDYEKGFPHTRNNIIILSEYVLNNNIVKTLIHEKVHIYQKTYPEDIKKYLDSNNFKKYLNRNEINQPLRANPDLDNYTYKMGDSIMMSVYNKNASDITDITTYPIDNSKYEHPLEYMAYTLAEVIN